MSEPKLIQLSTHWDARGALTEIFRGDWPDVAAPVQWNFVHSEANVLRGVHVHVTHVDYLVVRGACWSDCVICAGIRASPVQARSSNSPVTILPH